MMIFIPCFTMLLVICQCLFYWSIVWSGGGPGKYSYHSGSRIN